MNIVRKQKRYQYTVVLTVFVAAFVANTAIYHPAFAAVQSLIFPVIGNSSYSNDYNAPRSVGGTHRATDIIAGKHQKIVSASNGTIQYVIGDGEQGWETAGYSLRIRGTDGYTYNYYHINNDTPGTDNSKGGKMNAFAPDIEPGSRVIKGQHIGYVGDSGNAEFTVSHLHFEIYNGSTPVNPYEYLNRANHIGVPKIYPKRANEQLPLGRGSFRGGAKLAAGDVDGDGVDEIVTAAGPGGRSVKIFEKNGAQTGMFVPFGSTFKGGADVAVGDVDGDGVDEIVTAAGPGGRSVKIFEKNGAQTGMFVPFNATFKGGSTVAVADVSGDNKDEIIAAARKGGGPRIVIADNTGTQLSTFYAYTTTFNGGVRVEAGEIDSRFGKNEIITVAETKGSPKIRVRTATGTIIKDAPLVAEDWWRGYYDLSFVDDEMMLVLNINRRTSIRISEY